MAQILIKEWQMIYQTTNVSISIGNIKTLSDHQLVTQNFNVQALPCWLTAIHIEGICVLLDIYLIIEKHKLIFESKFCQQPKVVCDNN